jgi:Zn-dependent peptidase ImmA (M78 family)
MPTPMVNVKPQLLRWAIARSRIPKEDLLKKIPRLAEWEQGERQPTLRQLEDFARRTMTPLGHLFLPEPPVETLSVPDFRTIGDTPIDRPSPNLLDTIGQMQQRQAWMREYLIELGQEPLPFVGRADSGHPVTSVAEDIRATLQLTDDWAAELDGWEQALMRLRQRIDSAGILIAMNGVVGNNTHRPLDPEEFRGFVLIDPYAPLIFVNNGDFKAAQMFTLAHELAHVWLGKSALFNLVQMLPDERDNDEKFCNQVAAEFLVPRKWMLRLWDDVRGQTNPFPVIARACKVSGLVAARRALDLGLINRRQFFEFYERETSQLAARRQQRKDRSAGGDFYRTATVRIGRRFGEAIARAVAEGKLLYRDAYRLTGLKGEAFDRFASQTLRSGEA